MVSYSPTLTAQLLAIPEQILYLAYTLIQHLPLYHLVLLFGAFIGATYLANGRRMCSLAFCGTNCVKIFTALHIVAPKPRAPFPSEKTYITTNPNGTISSPRLLPCWYDRWFAECQLSKLTFVHNDVLTIHDTDHIEPAEVEVSVVIPAYNEEKRIIPALEEAIEYLDTRFGRSTTEKTANSATITSTTRHHRQVFTKTSKKIGKAQQQQQDEDETPVSGYEILIINDGSTDRTIDVVLDFSRNHKLHDILRIVTLTKNRGKGGGVTHGFRHARGAYAVFADADGASRFSDLDKLIEGCEDVLDASKRGVAIGSRGHLVGSKAVIQRSALRNFLMKSFHTVIKILTPPATSRIRDTQCGFKLFSRAALPHIIPYMHAEGWIFDIEMLMLAESAPPTTVVAMDGTVIGTSPGIRVAEVPIDWHEVGGSKMNLIKDSIGMAYGLAILRFSWMLGVYRRRTT